MKFPKIVSAFSNRGGFTLLEMLVVLGIMGVLSAGLISFSHTSRQQLALYAEQTRLAQAIFHAKSLALTSYVNPSGSVCGYGIHVDYSAMSYSVFSYSKGSVSDCQTINSIDANSENMITTATLNSNVKFIDPSQGVSRMDDILFIPPDPKVLIKSKGVMVSGSAAVVFQAVDGSLSATVSVNSAGLIGF